jgi:hypothetical protein
MKVILVSSARTQELIESKLEKKRKTRFGAPVGKRLLCFVDDVNMPMLEEYGAQSPIELLRQWLDFGGVYDRKKLFWKSVEDMTMVCVLTLLRRVFTLLRRVLTLLRRVLTLLRRVLTLLRRVLTLLRWWRARPRAAGATR